MRGATNRNASASSADDSADASRAAGDAVDSERAQLVQRTRDATAAAAAAAAGSGGGGVGGAAPATSTKDDAKQQGAAESRVAEAANSGRSRMDEGDDADATVSLGHHHDAETGAIVANAAALHLRGIDNSAICSLAGIWNVVVRRTALLITLLLLQSMSQFILESYEHLISFHIVVPLFLTMLVGAGGNAGNQAAVRVIAGLVTGQLTVAHTWEVLRSEVLIGLINGVVLAGIGFTRVYFMYEEGSGLFWSAIAITLSLICIVITSSVFGTLLPFLLEYLGIDREHAAPAIQVVMDICGVFITCVVCTMIIPESEHPKVAMTTTTAAPRRLGP